MTERGRANAARVIKDLAVEAQGHGVRLGIEICNRYETNVVNTTEQAPASSTPSMRTT